MDGYQKNAMKYIFILQLLLMLAPRFGFSQRKKWKLVWSDEFNNNGLPDSSKWQFETHGNSYGWGNSEKQFYTSGDTANAIVKNGMLHIIAKKENRENKEYTSARLSTSGKYHFLYGRIDVKAKLPAGRGTWPAIWMLGQNIGAFKWPACGEIDIMEHVGYEKDSLHGTVHTAAYNHIKGTQKGKAVFLDHPYTRFHLYSVIWTKEKVEFLLDDKVYHSFKNEHLTTDEWPFDAPFYIILNLAIGGNWGGKKGIDDSVFPATMLVDYVRVYQ